MKHCIYGVFKCDYKSSSLEKAYSNKEAADAHANLENTIMKTFSPYNDISYQVGEIEIHDTFKRSYDQMIPKNVALYVGYSDDDNKFKAYVYELYNKWEYGPNRKDMLRVVTKTIPSTDRYFRQDKWNNNVFYTIYLPYDSSKLHEEYREKAIELAKKYDEKYHKLVDAAKIVSPFGLIEDLHFKPENLDRSLSQQKIMAKLPSIKNAYTGYTGFHRFMELKDFADIDLLRTEVEDQKFYLEIGKGVN